MSGDLVLDFFSGSATTAHATETQSRRGRVINYLAKMQRRKGKMIYFLRAINNNSKNLCASADGFLMACFDKDVTDEVITAIAKKKPYYFVMRDSSLASDSVATNFDQIFATYSPETVRKVL